MKAAAALIALALSACTAVPAREGPRPARPTIVSLNPCTDAILVEVTAPGQLLALSHYSRDPSASSMDVDAARRFAVTGGTVEEVAALAPDLVVSGTFTPPATAAALAGLGLPLEQVPIAATVADSRAQIRRLAQLAGHPERGEALIARIDNALREAEPTEGSRAVSALVWQSGGMVPGPQTLIAELLGRTGFANAAAARGLGQADLLALEEVIAQPPELIIAAGNPRSAEDRLLAHPALAYLAETRRAALDPALLYCGGPTIIRTARRLADIRRTL